MKKILHFGVTLLTLLTMSLVVDHRVNATENGHDFEMEGIIGEWDPFLRNPFENTDELEGSIPNEGEYYTISVTVPLSMDFYVITESSLHGDFYAPKYHITNNGSKDLRVSVEHFLKQEHTDPLNEPLYVEPVVPLDGRVQIELYLAELLDLDGDGKYVTGNVIELYKLSEHTPDNQKVLFDLIRANQQKTFTFNATKWELPETVKDQDGNVSNTEAVSAFETQLKFEIIR